MGKSDLAIDLALHLDGEIINADAMQLYQGLDIATAKLLQSEQKGVPHHLLDVYSVAKEATVAEYQELARTAIKDVISRDKYPILVGGSGLYITSVIDDLTFQEVDKEIRDKLQARADRGEDLYAELRLKDRKATEKILPGNTRRVIRALEVIEITGQPYSAALPNAKAIFKDQRIGLDLTRDVLDQRIDLRVEKMFEQGIVAEVQAVQSVLGVTAKKALGVSQVLAYLSGTIDLAQAKADTALATRKFARRQLSWFRRDQKITWLNAQGRDLFEQAHRLALK